MDSISGLTAVNLNLGVSSGNSVSSMAKTAEMGESKGMAATDFATALANAGKDFVQTVEKAEATSIAGINGQATTYEVATTMMEAEQALQMAVAVRERITSAYMEISRMQI